MRALGFTVILLVLGYQQPGSSTQLNFVGDAEEGRSLIVSYGCAGCHAIPSLTGIAFRGPALDNAGEKLRQEWLRAWLRDPKAIDPAARMGNFHLTGDQIESLEAFLLSLRVTAVPADDSRWDGADGHAGAALFTALQCSSCHAPSAAGFAGLERIGRKVRRDWLLDFLNDPPALQPGTPMRAYGLTNLQLRDLAVFLLEQGRPATDVPPTAALPHADAVMAGQIEFERLSCGSCHSLNGVRQPPLVGLPMKADDVVRKLVSPESFAASNMPAFHLTSKEASSIALAIRNTQ